MSSFDDHGPQSSDYALRSSYSSATEPDTSPKHKRPPRPLILHPITRWSLVVSLVVLGSATVGLNSYSQNHKGLFTITPRQGLRDDLIRSLWSSGPTFLMTIIAGGVLFPVALAIYPVAHAELENGRQAKAEESIGVNYGFLDSMERLWLAVRNRKWGLLSLTIATVLAFWLNVAASGLIESRNVIVCIVVVHCSETHYFG